MCVCVYVCMYVCIFMCVCTMYVCTFIILYVYVFKFVCIYVRIPEYMSVRIFYVSRGKWVCKCILCYYSYLSVFLITELAKDQLNYRWKC
jgi:hypothetical protein